MRFKSIYVSQIPIATGQQTEQIERTVNQILSINKDDDYLRSPQKQAQVKEYEREIDQMVYELYGLTEEEIAIVEGKE